MKKYPLYIGGKWLDSENGATFFSYDKATGSVVNEFSKATLSDVNKACVSARNAFQQGIWSDLDGNERAGYLLRVASILNDRYQELAEYESIETGKSLLETTRNDIKISIWAFEYFGNLAREIKGEVIPTGHHSNFALDFVQYEPYGVAAILAPYNFPLHLLTRSLAPALAAGNTCIVKASSLTPTTTAILGEVFEAARVPAGTLNIIHGYGVESGNALAGNPEVNIIGFTGSEPVGRELLKISASSSIIKKCVLELGGKGPAVFLPDSDIEVATDCQIKGFTTNAGQVCCAMTRAIVHEDIYDAFLELLMEKCKKVKIGYMLDKDTTMGCLISEKHLLEIDTKVHDAVRAGARIFYGGKRYTEGSCSGGPFYYPTIITEVTTDMPIWRDEIFGPVLCVVKYNELDEAVVLANDTAFGLGANIFTRNLQNAYHLSKKINAGSIWVNLHNGMNMACPFGGNKNSGMGREYGTFGLHEYLKVKNNMWRM